MNGRAALITGGSSGIGLAIARALGADGYSLTVAARRAEKLEEAAEDLRAEGFEVQAVPAQMTAEDEVVAMVAAHREGYGRLDVLVNNAGFLHPQPSHEVADDDWNALLDVHLGGTFRCARAAYPALVDAPDAAVVNVASVAGRRGMPWRLSYSAAKAGIEAVTRTLAVEWAAVGIRVNAVAPGFVLTPAVAEVASRGLVDEERLGGLTPLGRMGRPDEVAAAVCYLASPEASYVTGHTLVVDGGLTVSAASWVEAGP